MTSKNIDVKLEAISKGVKLYEIPEQLGFSMSKFNAILSHEMTDEMREKILNAIKEIAENRWAYYSWYITSKSWRKTVAVPQRH